LMLFAVPWWWWQTRSARPPFVQLAAAYSSRRMVELRIPGASYAPLRVNRATGAGDAPPELLESQAQIQRYLAKNAPSSEWLHARGRAQVLVWEFDAALDSFQTAEEA